MDFNRFRPPTGRQGEIDSEFIAHANYNIRSLLTRELRLGDGDFIETVISYWSGFGFWLGFAGVYCSTIVTIWREDGVLQPLPQAVYC